MNKRVLLYVLLTILPFSGFGQSAYKILASKGKIEIKKGSGWAPVKTGMTLKATDEIRLSGNSYLGLVATNGKPIELKEARSYKISELLPLANAQSSVLSKYTDFILSSTQSQSNKLTATGAVHRATDQPPIIVYLPEQTTPVLNSKIVVNWELRENSQANCVMVFRNAFDETVGEIPLTKKQVTIDLSEPKLDTEKFITLSIESRTDPGHVSKKYLIKLLTEQERNTVKAKINDLLNQIPENTAINSLIRAHIYEEQKLLIDAITSYEEAIRLEPGVKMYKEEYEKFLFRNNIK